MKLHEAIEQVLKQEGKSMTTTEIANALNKNKWYSKKDGSSITAYQIHGRTKNYRHLFKRDGTTVSLKSKTGIATIPQISSTSKTSLVSAVMQPDLAVKVLMNEKNFKLAEGIDEKVPDQPGLYCIRIKENDLLPEVFSTTLKERKHNVVYIGIATQNLKTRMLGQELRAKGHGTFFRSLGAVLGYRPESGSLSDKKNKNNFTFSEDDEKKIIAWINDNLLINWVTLSDDLNTMEDDLLKAHLPLLNIAGNPGALKELSALREECKRIAKRE